jgi:hypothetical protein
MMTVIRFIATGALSVDVGQSGSHALISAMTRIGGGMNASLGTPGGIVDRLASGDNIGFRT